MYAESELTDFFYLYVNWSFQSLVSRTLVQWITTACSCEPIHLKYLYKISLNTDTRPVDFYFTILQ
jgi:hypothetical protein